MDKKIKQRVVDMFNNVDGQLATQIAQGIGATPPTVPGGSGVTAASPALSQENTIKLARTRKVAILVEDGFNYLEVTQFMQAMMGAGIKTEIVSKNQGMITSIDGMQLEVNKNYVTTGSIKYDAIYIAGGQQSVNTLKMQGDALHFINEAFKHCKTIGATNEGVDLLNASQIKGVTVAVTGNQSQLVSQLGVVTIRNTAEIAEFNQEFINAVAQHRHWAREIQKGQIPG